VLDLARIIRRQHEVWITQIDDVRAVGQIELPVVCASVIVAL